MHIHVYYSSLNRFDQANGKPFSGSPGDLFLHRTFDLHKDITYDVRVIDTADESKPLLSGALILGLGTKACARLAPDDNLNKHRGYCLTYQTHPTIVTYDPISCWEFKLLDEDEDDDDADGDEKDVARTKRSNYLFWSLADFRKLLQPRKPIPVYKKFIRPPVDMFVTWASNLSGHVVLDIETRVQDHTLDCIGLSSVDKQEAYIIPLYTPNNALAYSQHNTTKIWRALYNLLTNPNVTIVGHNLSFDLSILAALYHLPLPPKIYDTMLAMHREFPMVDKSLSHAISYYTSARRNHKGDIRTNTTDTNFRELLEYNAEDLIWTAEVMKGQALNTDPALQVAREGANRLQLLTLVMSLTGINIDTSKLEPTKDALRLKYAQLLRCIQILTENNEFNPNSPKQVGEYFYDKLNYPVIEVTKTGARSTGAKTMYKLQLLQDNPLIPLIIEAKETKKSLSMFEAQLYEKTRI